MSLSRTGPPREGFEYQDLHGVLVLLDWLAHPSSYEWVKFEAREYGSLDDFAVCSPDRHLWLYQVKHTGETPDRPRFTFDDLTDVPQTGQRSLFEKWYRSWNQSVKRGVFASITPILKTNKPPSSEMLAVTNADRGGLVINIARLKSEHPDWYDTLIAITGKGTRGAIDKFLRALHFEFDLPDIPVLRELAEERCRALSVNSRACRDLEDEVWNWAKHGTELTLADVKRACGWLEPRGLEERFPIPSDYVPLGVRELDELVNVIAKTADGGIRAVIGAPGSGKSTFLEDLYRRLSEKKIASVRHHYYVPGTDRYNRLRFDDAASALIHEIERRVPGAFPSINPAPQQFESILSAVATNLRSRALQLVIILDGLDHVVRDEDENELLELLRKLLPTKPGLWVVLGTRDFPASSRIKLLLEENVPSESWVPMPRFDWNGCAELIRFHRSELRLDNDHHFEEVVSAFFKVTDGYPLYARYVVTRLKQMAAAGVLLASDIEQIEPFGGDVPTLYNQIWKSLSPTAQGIAILLAVAQFEMTSTELSTALRSVSPIDALDGIEAVWPLLEEGIDGLQFFHPSFAEFVRATDSFLSLAPRLRRDLILWLENDAPEPKRWTWLLRKKAEDGATEPLIASTTRSWIIGSIHEGRDPGEVVSTLELASSAAMAKDDYGRALARGQYAIYIANSLQFFGREWGRLDIINRRRISGSALPKDASSDIMYRDSEFLVELARDADSTAARPVIGKILDELNERLFSRGRQSPTSAGKDMKDSVAHLLRVAALLRGRTTRAVRFIKQLNREYQTVAAISFADELVKSKQAIAFSEFVKSPQLRSAVATAAGDAGALAALHARVAIDGTFTRTGPWLRIRQALSTGSPPVPIRLPNPKSIPHTLPDYEMNAQGLLTDFYRDLFAKALLAAHAGKTSVVEMWMRRVRGGWGHEAAKLVAQFAVECGIGLRDRHELQPGSIQKFNDLNPLEFGRDREIWGFQASLRNALMQIFRISITILHDVTGASVGAAIVRDLCGLTFFNEYFVTELMNTLPSRVLHAEDTRAWISKQVDKWNSAVEEFPTRAEAYLLLASLSIKIGDNEAGGALIKQTIENMLSYGNHKDLFLLEVIEAIDASAKVSGHDRIRAWLKRVAPIANSVRSFTDGDETSYLAVTFGESLARHDRFAAFREYVDLIHEERLYLAEDLFAKLIPYLDLSEPFEYAVARTCTDNDSRHELNKLSASGAVLAARIEDELNAKYGPYGASKETSAWAPEKENEPNVDEIGPDKIEETLSSLRYSSNRARFVEKWLSFWMPRQAEAAYTALKPRLEANRRAIFDADVFLYALPYVQQFEGPESAFSMICKAHRASYGWSRFFISQDTVDQMFNFIQREYPGRWREYIRCTLKGARSDSYGVLPVPVGTRFLVQFGAVADTTSHCEAAVKTLEELVEALSLPAVQWIDHPASAIDVLFARLFWISPVVRERVAFVLSDLLLTPGCSDHLLGQFLAKMRQERLDSRLVVLLTPIVRAARHGFRPDMAAVRNALPRISSPVGALVEAIEAAR